MKNPNPNPGSPFAGTLDALLADIAIRIQLSQTAHRKAVQRYDALRDWIEREGSPLAGWVVQSYPQGSMAIGAAIASKLTNDDFDLDFVLQVACSSRTPQQILDLLFEVINGEPGSRYHGKARRRTRCVTVEYADLHLDVTPAERRDSTPERESWIFHHRPPENPGHRVIANPYGFAEWFKRCTTPDTDFGMAYASRVSQYEQGLFLAAESEPVPPNEPLPQKSLAVVALQLLKRWRNVQYQRHSGRKPPSIVMSKLVADTAGQANTLSAEMLHQAQSMLSFFEQAHRSCTLVHVANPVCEADVLTDKWPGTLNDQAVFVTDLRRLVEKLKHLKECDLGEMKQVMVELFGEGPAAQVVEDFARRNGDKIRKGHIRHQPKTGRIIGPGVAGGAASSGHSFYGGKWWQ